MKAKSLAAMCVLISVLAVFTGLPGYAQSSSVKLATGVSPDTSVGQAMQFFQEELMPESGERVPLRIFADSLLGSDETVMQGVRYGHIEMALLRLNVVLNLSPELAVVATPALFRDRGHRLKALDGPIGQNMLKALEQHNFLGLGFFDAEPQAIFSFREPITNAADLEGLALGVAAEECREQEAGAEPAVSDEPAERPWWEGIEELMLPGVQWMPFCAEQQDAVVAAIADGDLDAWKGPLAGWNRVAAFQAERVAAVVLADFDPPLALVVNSAWFEALIPEQQEAVTRAARLAGMYQRQRAEERLQAHMAEMRAAGMSVEVAAESFFSQTTPALSEQLRAELGDNFDTILQALERVK